MCCSDISSNWRRDWPAGAVSWCCAGRTPENCAGGWATGSTGNSRRRRDALKAWLQRRAYRRAMRAAAVMAFNSRYMQEAYRANAGFAEKRGLVVPQAADEATRERAAAGQRHSRSPNLILGVSVMAPHKNIEALARDYAEVRARRAEARHVLAGSWPDAAYERKIRALIEELGLREAVEFAGFVSRAQLDGLYAAARVFCLMSRCESFGIPAIEAQLFGTPVVSSSVCAIPEICGEGGFFRDPDDVAGIAAALRTLIEDEAEWRKRSDLARSNAARFAWSRCSQPLVDLFAEWTDS